MQTPVRAARIPGSETLWMRTLDRLLEAAPRRDDDRAPTLAWPANDDRLPLRTAAWQAPERRAG